MAQNLPPELGGRIHGIRPDWDVISQNQSLEAILNRTDGIFRLFSGVNKSPFCFVIWSDLPRRVKNLAPKNPIPS